MTLPTNPQAMTASERLIIETLHQQGETLSYQTKVLQSLTNQLTRQRRNDEKVSKKQNPSPMVDKNKRNSDDYLDKFKDYSAEVFGKAMGDIREYFTTQTKNEKLKPPAMSESSGPKNKKSKNTEDTDVLKNILQSMVVTTKYQEQLTENLKSLKTLSDKTLSSVTSIRDDINVIKASGDADNNDGKINNKNTSENSNKKTPLNAKTVKNTSENSNKKTPLNAKTVKNTDPLDIIKFSKAIGLEVSSRLVPSFDKLGKTFTDNIEYAVETLSEILSNTQQNSSIPIGAPAGSPSPKSGTGNALSSKGIPSSAAPASAALPLAASASRIFSATAGLLAAPVLLSTMDDPEDLDRMRKKEKAEKEAALKQKGSRQAEGKLETNKQKYTEVPEGEVVTYNGKDYKKQADGSLADSKGNALSPNVQKNVESVYLDHLNKKGMSSVDFNNEMNSKMDQLLNQTPAAKEKTNSVGQRGPGVGEEENYKRLQRAEKVPEEAIKWAEKRYNDPNMRDPGYLAEPKNSQILDWLEKNSGYIKNNPTYNLDKQDKENKVKPKSDKVSQNLDMQPMASILKGVETENTVLSENNSMNAAPIVVNNNTTVASTGSGSGMSFVSGLPVNTNTAINDFFRYNGRIFA